MGVWLGSHQVEGCNAHRRDEEAIDQDHGAELRRFGDARDTAESTRSQRPSHSLRQRPPAPRAADNEGEGEDDQGQAKETGDMDPSLQAHKGHA